MKNFISIVGLILISFSLYGQTGNINRHQQLLNDFRQDVNEYQRLENRYDNIKGTPYFTDEFQQGQIFIKGNESFTDVKLNYNKYSDEFEFVADGGRIFLLSNLDEVKKVVYAGKTFRHISYKYTAGKAKEGYLIELVDGKCSLYKKQESEFREEKKPETGYDSYKPPRFVDKNPEYFIKREGYENARDIASMRRRKFLKNHFKDRRKELLDWMRDNNINLRNEDEMIRFVQYVNK